jgi:hypothetical protein
MLLKWKLFYGNLELVGVWPSGKATGFGPVIQRFESFHPSIAVLLIVMKIEHKLNLSLSEIRNQKRIV